MWVDGQTYCHIEGKRLIFRIFSLGWSQKAITMETEPEKSAVAVTSFVFQPFRSTFVRNYIPEIHNHVLREQHKKTCIAELSCSFHLQ